MERIYRETDRLLTTQALAERLGVQADTIRRWARNGRIPTYRIGQKTLRFDHAEVIDVLRACRRAEPAETPG